MKIVPEAEAAPEAAAPGTLPAESGGEHKARTPGLRLFDVFLYPVVTNLSVFGISVAATYLTARGGDRTPQGKLVYGKIGEFFQKRGTWLIDKFKGMGMTHGQADMSKMVFFSFLDGSLMAPVVKLVEDRREDIGCFIDQQLGTKPEDMSVYAKEPKQTWLSVLGGRFATAAIVVPTAVALDKTGLNDTLFNNPGKRMGEWLAKKPGVVKWFRGLDVKELSRISFFEAFYTSVCTAGLYFSSRALARATNPNGHKHPGTKPDDELHSSAEHEHERGSAAAASPERDQPKREPIRARTATGYRDALAHETAQPASALRR